MAAKDREPKAPTEPKEPTEVKPKGTGRGQKPKKQAKANAGAPQADWQSFLKPAIADVEAESAAKVDGEGADASPEVVPAKKKLRATRQDVVLGEDEEGFALPEDDTSNYTAAQIYVAKKYAKTNSDFSAELQKAKQSGKLEFRRFVNSKIMKSAAMANSLTPPVQVESTMNQSIELSHNKTGTARTYGKTLTAWEVAWGDVRQDLVHLSFRQIFY